MKRPTFTQEQLQETLDKIYTNVVCGTIPGQKNCYELASDYLDKCENDKEKAIKEFSKWQIAKCTTTGFLTNLGGLITLPVAIPANLGVVWYVQLQMIATIATICGKDPTDDETQTMAYMCLVGMSIAEACKTVGVQAATKSATALLKKLPGAILTKINKAVGYRLLTKFGETGVINLVKLVPVAGGIVGGGVDFAGTKIMSSRALKMFLYDEID